MTNMLIAIGYLGTKRVYLNVHREIAILRWMVSEDTDVRPADDLIEEVDIEDEFWSYDIGPPHS